MMELEIAEAAVKALSTSTFLLTVSRSYSCFDIFLL